MVVEGATVEPAVERLDLEAGRFDQPPPLERRQLIEEAGFEVEALYGWFDRRPHVDEEDTIWICRTRGS